MSAGSPPAAGAAAAPPPSPAPLPPSPPPVSPPPPPPPVVNPQAEALLSFKSGLSNADALGSWTSAAADPCSGWKGVGCDGKGNVVSL